MRKRSLVIAAGAAASVLALVSWADITGSDHDFSSEGWSDNQICLPCHTPHNADTTVALAPLWNHELTTESNYTLYGGGTGDQTDFDGISRLCMSCHDGTVALDSFGGTAGTVFLQSGDDGYIGTDLSDDHPVGSTAVYPTVFTDYADPATFPAGFELKDLSGDDVVSCGTCHDPHNGSSFDHMVRIDTSGSQLCLTCHLI